MDQKQLIQERKSKLIELTDAFCAKHADDEYRKLADKLINKMARKRAVPFVTGGLNVWAAGIIHALGTINFLFDKSFRPYASLDDIAAFFGCAKTTLTNKSKQIRDMFNLHHWDREFSTQKSAGERDHLAVLAGGLYLPKEVMIIWDGEQVGGDRHPAQNEFDDILWSLNATGPTRALEKRLRGVIETHPDFLSAYEKLAEVLLHQGKTIEADEVLTIAQTLLKSE